jgi:hypothetical protein
MVSFTIAAVQRRLSRGVLGRFLEIPVVRSFIIETAKRFSVEYHNKKPKKNISAHAESNDWIRVADPYYDSLHATLVVAFYRQICENQWYGSPDPYQNVTDPQHYKKHF